MTNIIAILAILLIAGLAIAYLIHEKKRGVTCIGCPHAKTCPSAKAARHTCGGTSCSTCSDCSSCGSSCPSCTDSPKEPANDE